MKPEDSLDLQTKRLGQIVQRAADFVLDLLSTSLQSRFVFHNQRLTVLTVHAVRQIGLHQNLSQDEIHRLEIAAWFHNTGFVREAKNPINSAAAFTNNFLERNGVDIKEKHQIIAAIRHTAHPHKVENLMEQVLYDAKWYFLAASNCKEMLQRMRQELAFQNEIYLDEEWRSYVARMVYGHEYLTEYGFNVLEKQKRRNFYTFRSHHGNDRDAQSPSHVDQNRMIF